MIMMLMLLIVVSACEAHAQGGGGVKNGGTAIQCPKEGPAVNMLEVREVLLAGGKLSRVADRTSFFNNIFTALKNVRSNDATRLAKDLNRMLNAHGPLNSWPLSKFRFPTILFEDDRIKMNVNYVDWQQGVVYLQNGCRMFPVSYLTSNDSGPAKPQIVKSNADLLDHFNQNVLELHEAIYDLFVSEALFVINVRPTRKLGRALLNTSLSRDALKTAISDFYLAMGNQMDRGGMFFNPYLPLWILQNAD